MCIQLLEFSKLNAQNTLDRTRTGNLQIESLTS